MKFSLSILSFLTVAAAAPLSDPVSEYVKLLKLCNSSSKNTYVGVLYSDGKYRTFEYNQCYPYRIGDNTLAQQAVFCKSVTCTSNPNPDCSGGSNLPVSVPLPAGTTLVNAADFVELLGAGATYEPNGIPI